LLVLYIGLFIAVTDNHYWTVLPQLSGSAAHTHTDGCWRPLQALDWNNAG